MDFGSIEELYKTDETLVNEGAPITIGMNAKDEPIIMYVAEAGNPKHKKAQRKYDRQLEIARNNPDRRRLLMAKIVAESILLGWKGVMDSKGKEVPYTIPNGIDALLKYDKLNIEIMDAATDIENYRPAEAETEKNLKTS
ncbi:MAG TPA: hypothetical protein VMW95_00295 [Desulfobacterales bacterium]|nr:hypothetical protein [Desulfobacterales bacterium]